jgi:hypothetical protein
MPLGAFLTFLTFLTRKLCLRAASRGGRRMMADKGNSNA